MAPNPEAFTRDLLSRAHSPSSVDRIYAEKIQHRPINLRATSPTPATDGREARRRAREQKAKERRKALKPKPLSRRERRRLGLYRLSVEGRQYELFEPLHELWLGYIREVLGQDLYGGGISAATKLSSADFHGSEVEVVRSRCPSRVGIKGIVVKDSRFAFEIITRKNCLKLVPKEGTIFRVEVTVATPGGKGETAAQEQKELENDSGINGKAVAERKFIFEVHGSRFQFRSADRANKKFKAHFRPEL